MIAEFQLWKPTDVDTPKAIIVLTPPSQSDGRWDTKDRGWRLFAKRYGCALVGCHFRDQFPSGIEEYANARISGQALIDFISEKLPGYDFTKKLLLFGFSAGGQFNYEFAVNYPQLVKAFVVNKGGIYYTALAPPATRATPGLLIVGKFDDQWRQMILNGIFMVNRVAGAVWEYFSEPCGHDLCQSEFIGRKFFAKVLERT